MLIIGVCLLFLITDLSRYRTCGSVYGGFYFLTSSLRTPKVFVKEFSYFLMPCHQHCLGVNLLVQR